MVLQSRGAFGMNCIKQLLHGEEMMKMISARAGSEAKDGAVHP
jgi:hypothetical protein